MEEDQQKSEYRLMIMLELRREVHAAQEGLEAPSHRLWGSGTDHPKSFGSDRMSITAGVKTGIALDFQPYFLSGSVPGAGRTCRTVDLSAPPSLSRCRILPEQLTAVI
jgi:hypothetical protein